MPYINDLEAAGQRAALQPVPQPPSVDTLRAAAGGHRSTRRLVASAAAMLVILAVGVPLALNMRGSATVQTVAAGSAAAQEGSQQTPAGSQPDPAPGGVAGAQDDSGSGEDAQPDEDSSRAESEGRFELRIGGDTMFSINAIRGADAQRAADAAAAGAAETRDVDGNTVWISTDGTTTTVSALVEPGLFVSIEGPADQLDELIDIVGRSHVDLPDFPPVPDLDHEEFFDRFFQDGQLPALEDLEDLFQDGQLPRLEDLEGFNDLFPDGQIPDLDDLEGLEDLFPDGQIPDLDDLEGFGDLFPNGKIPALDDLEDLFQGFLGDEGCISLNVSGDEDFTFEFPQGCSSSE